MHNFFKSSYLPHTGTLPLVLEPKEPLRSIENTLKLIHSSTSYIHEQLNSHGAILFRNFPIESGEAFASMVKALDLGPFEDYIGGDSPRIKVTDGVFTSTEAPPWLQIPLHNELSYAQKPPSHIHFYCSIAPQARGETPIADARKVLQALDPKIREEFIKKGVTYRSAYHSGKGLIRTLVGPSHRSWQEVFGTSERHQVEEICKARNISFRWAKNGWLELEETRKATAFHPKSTEEVWFNQAHIFKLTPRMLGFWRYLGMSIIYFNKNHLLHNATFGDGSPIPDSIITHIFKTLDSQTISFPWNKGDLLVLDNYLTMHGRSTFKGPRKIMVSMTSIPKLNFRLIAE